MQVIDSVELSELDCYTANRLTEIVTKFKVAQSKQNTKVENHLWCAFYETELLRIELDLPKLCFNNAEQNKLYKIMLSEARHHVLYGNESLVR